MRDTLVQRFLSAPAVLSQNKAVPADWKLLQVVQLKTLIEFNDKSFLSTVMRLHLNIDHVQHKIP
jgi:hypothetical protein